MELASVLRYIYPDITFGDDGDVELHAGAHEEPQIVRWNYPQPQPTDDELVVAEAEWLASYDPWEYTITPMTSLVKPGQDVVIDISSAPGVETIEIKAVGGDAVSYDVEIGDDGNGSETFVPTVSGTYIIIGKSGALANCVSEIKAVE